MSTSNNTSVLPEDTPMSGLEEAKYDDKKVSEAITSLSEGLAGIETSMTEVKDSSGGLVLGKDLSQVVIRLLSEEDYDRGFPNILQQLTEVGEVSREQFLATLRRIQKTQLEASSLASSIHVFVAHDLSCDRIVASSTLLVEDKFIHQCGKVGHVEDVVVESEYRGRNLGTLMMKRLIQEAKTAGCYKVILDCHDDKVKFYESVGYWRKSAGMAVYF